MDKMSDVSMHDKAVWLKYEIKNYLRVKFSKEPLSDKQQNTCCGKRVLDIPATNRIIGDALAGGEPFWAGRMGQTEMNMLRQVMEHRMIPRIDHREAALKQLCRNAGFFPYDMEYAERYTDLVLKDCTDIDMQGYWHLYMEDYMHDVYQRDTMITRLSWLEPWRACADKEVRPWSSRLKGKKVLVVHPFEKSIRTQYEKNREKIFSNKPEQSDILPEFELKTLKAVQTIAGTKDQRFRDWFEALEWMKSECHKIDFDVAIVGCGAYGYHLAAEIKRMGKQAIHLGGATQFLFGIMGKRWEAPGYREMTEKFLNSFWVRPSEEEKPNNSVAVEEGCYW
ncbi:MAG: hypothetical protein HDR21_08525 [Lachnospiraceae bacterium]|nr:hypothetical protein [Lachnospiraceae bacterium]MBD5483053.1 hypothetical protein [Lachnospiraceae bacterium]